MGGDLGPADRAVGADDGEAAARELELFFPEGIVEYDYAAFGWIYDPVEELGKK